MNTFLLAVLVLDLVVILDIFEMIMTVIPSSKMLNTINFDAHIIVRKIVVKWQWALISAITKVFLRLKFDVARFQILFYKSCQL